MKSHTTPNKLSNAYNQSLKNKNDLIIQNSLIKSGDAEYFKKVVEYYNSGWQNITVTATNDRTTKKNTLLPAYYDYSLSHNIEISESLLPFLEPIVEIKCLDEQVQLTTIPEFETSFWRSGYYESYGDGELIYKGFNNKYNSLYGHQNLINGDFLENHTQKAWQIAVFYTIGTTQYWFVGTVIGARYNYPYASHYYVGILPTSPYIGGKFNNFAETSGDWYANVDAIKFVSQEIVTLNLGLTDTNCAWEVVGNTYKKVGASWVATAPTGLIYGSTITSATISFNYDSAHSGSSYSGYYLFWDTDKTWLFQITSNEPSNLPNTDEGELPYNTITWKYNPIGQYPISEKTSEIITDTYQQIHFFKLDELSSTNKYKFLLDGTFYVLIRAGQLDYINTYNHYNDSWTPSGDTYVRTTTNHTTEDKNKYMPIDTDMQYRVRLMLVNPYFDHVERQIK